MICPKPHATCLVQPQNHSSKTSSWGCSWGDTVGNSPGDMESLPAAVPITGHARSRGCFALPALLFTDVAGLQKRKKRITHRQTTSLSLFSRRQSLQELITCVQSSPSYDSSSGLFLGGMNKTYASFFFLPNNKWV